MASHSSTLAWKIPWTEKPGRLQSMGSQRVGNDWATSFSLFIFMHWRRKWQPTPVFLPGESQGRRSLADCGLRGRTESDTTETTRQQRYLSLTALGLHGFVLAFSSNGSSLLWAALWWEGAVFHFGVWAFHCDGFFCCRAWALGVVAHGLSSCSAWA